eukprot:TRINITY_DN2480_c0_g1_i1.p3 TRINITY_DN2480_c0_g1~~TRINITY_DN2480_c0_g1_i1.p3  ORF type:complete len:191 (-),score=14.75 TRINITY_DN2480_c0_g1_i1:134-706(-)
MNTCSLILYGLVDILFEAFGFLIAQTGGLKVKGIDNISAFESPGDIMIYGSMILDVVKTVVVIAGFLCAGIVSGGISEQAKKHLLIVITIIQWIILVPAILMAVFIEGLLLKEPPEYIDWRAVAIVVFFMYATLKFVTFYGFCEFLKNFVHDVHKVEGLFGYFPVNIYRQQQEPYQIPGYSLQIIKSDLT